LYGSYGVLYHTETCGLLILQGRIQNIIIFVSQYDSKRAWGSCQKQVSIYPFGSTRGNGKCRCKINVGTYKDKLVRGNRKCQCKINAGTYKEKRKGLENPVLNILQ
jgi:hypothetical protein